MRRRISPIRRIEVLLIGALTISLPCRTCAIGQTSYVGNQFHKGDFQVAKGKTVAWVWVDTNDFSGVVRAASDLQQDIRRVTGSVPKINHGKPQGDTIIIGTIGKSSIIDRLIREKKIDVSGVGGQWESFLIRVVSKPLPGVGRALVIAGSDKRGTIYGTYDLSEQMGVSPWYWWADVPVRHRDALFVKAGTYRQGPPTVKYRGIFLNDEAPALSGWAKEKFGNLNHKFYTNVFELILRLKGNYLWPAMWDNSFATDDPLTPKLADEYGVVVSTSHHEPMMRAWKEWGREGNRKGSWDYSKNAEKLQKFWSEGLRRTRDYEKVITLGMRGDGDEPMSETESVALLERIVADQRKMISEMINPDVASVPQVWALYKEVQGYYERGMRVPDDVTLLWCDDNWGNLRRLPTDAERKRRGGAGIYYHFDYVGGPRNYKWLNTNPLPKIWEQMNLAWQYDATRLWIVNVGDLKPMEFPIEYFLTLAWNPAAWPKERIAEFTKLWAAREFGPEHADKIAEIMAKYTKFNGRRKPELLEPSTFSLLNYQEADRVLGEWAAILEEAERINTKLPADARDAFFELVLHPTKACAILHELYVSAAKNHLYAGQGRVSANDFAARTRELFRQDSVLADYYNHRLAGGKWNHMMDQTHIGYTYWQQPDSNSMPKLEEVQVAATGGWSMAVEGSESAWPNTNATPALPDFDVFNQPRHYLDVFNRGQSSFQFSAKASDPWIVLSNSSGSVEKETRIWVNVDWDKAPKGSTTGSVTVEASGEPGRATIKIFNPEAPSRQSVKGFVEAGGYVSMEAVHYTKNVESGSVRWEKIDDLGRTLSAMTVFPVTATSVEPPADPPHLEYSTYLFTTGTVQVTSFLGPYLNFMPDRGVRMAVSFDDETPRVQTIVPRGYVAGDGNRDWEESVRDAVRKVKSIHTIEQPGYHTFKVWMVDPAVVLQKIVIDTGGLKPSYLGPPESYHQL